MIRIEEALAHVLRFATPLLPAETPLDSAVGHVLAADIESDIDSPPHDKSIVDGFAIRSEELASGEGEFTVRECVTAGDWPSLPVTHGTAAQIMTGAPIPDGADAVVMMERSDWKPDNPIPSRLILRESNIGPGQNILRRGRSLHRGQVVLRAGQLLRPPEIGLLAEVGRAVIPAFPEPRVAIVATGNELVSVDTWPHAGQIRNSNGPMLVACTQAAGARGVDLGIARDTHDDLMRRVQIGLQHDVLLLSGGVSAGILDLVPQVLSELGVQQVFHKVRLKPGKPLWFGVAHRMGGTCLVFGLPGNPVSSLVGFELFVRPALAALAGHPSPRSRFERLPLATPYAQRGDRVTFHPVTVIVSEGMSRVHPLPWSGSADLRAITDADGLARFPEGSHDYSAGDWVDVYRF